MDLNALSDHHLMINSLVQQLKNYDYSKIKADFPGYEMPILTEINHKSDATAYKDDKFYIFEIETADSLFKDRSHRNWLSVYILAQKYDFKFVLVVPLGYIAKTRLLLSELGIYAEIWTPE